MPFTRNARFTETVDYIRGYAASGLPVGVRYDIETYVTAQFPRLTPADAAAFNALTDEMSVKGRIAPGVARGTEEQRQQRRALVVLWRAMGVTLPVPADVNPKVQQAMNLAPAALGAELNETMLKAAVCASGAGAAHVFNMEFAANPLGFITTRRIFIYGTAAAGAGGPLNVFGNGVGNIVPHGGGNAFYPPKTPNAGPGQMRWMSIFGRLNGAWEFYTRSIDGANAIMEARRIL